MFVLMLSMLFAFALILVSTSTNKQTIQTIDPLACCTRLQEKTCKKALMAETMREVRKAELLTADLASLTDVIQQDVD